MLNVHDFLSITHRSTKQHAVCRYRWFNAFNSQKRKNLMLNRIAIIIKQLKLNYYYVSLHIKWTTITQLECFDNLRVFLCRKHDSLFNMLPIDKWIDSLKRLNDLPSNNQSKSQWNQLIVELIIWFFIRP